MITNKEELTLTKLWVKEFDKQIEKRSNLTLPIEMQNTKSMVKHRNSLYREIKNYKR